MREILFRGKRVYDGKWVEGFFCGESCDSIFSPMYEQANIIKKGTGMWSAVIPETVGQYTGLKDKNGKRIFEGDIVEFCDIKGVINYNTGCYCVKTNKPDWKSRNNPAIDIVLNEYENELEIIGNIHDNPELLEVEKC